MDDATPMMKLFHKREGLIMRGYYNARPPLYLSLMGSARVKARKKFMQRATKAARAQAKMVPGDPFVFDRAMAQMKSGLLDPSDVPLNRMISI